MAKVTLSFPDWKEGKVARTTFEIPVIDPEPTKEEDEKQPIQKTAAKK